MFYTLSYLVGKNMKHGIQIHESQILEIQILNIHHFIYLF